MAIINPSLPIITSNENGLTYVPEDTEWLNGFKKKLIIWCLQETHFRFNDIYSLKVNGQKKILHRNDNQKRAETAILTSDKTDFKLKIVVRDRKRH